LSDDRPLDERGTKLSLRRPAIPAHDGRRHLEDQKVELVARKIYAMTDLPPHTFAV
jgi:hypothetical protein